jgi:segregation and condensation protein B
MSLIPKLEAILFVASKPLSIKIFVQSTGANAEEVIHTLDVLKEKFNHDESGIHLLQSDDMYQLVSNPALAENVEKFIQKEITSELTKAQLETLTVIAYRGPITRPEIEQIRGVNCAIIIRNLLIRGLIDEKFGVDDLVPSYALSIDALRVLGVDAVTDLPEYETLHAHEYLDRALETGVHDI